MKSKRAMIIVAVCSLIAVGCTAPADKQTTEPGKRETDASRQAASGTGSTSNSDPSAQAGQSKSKIVLDARFLPMLKENRVQGIDIAIGATKESMLQRYGAVTKQDFTLSCS